jgi:hypothetical protein
VAGRGGGGSGAASGMTRPIQAKLAALPIIIFGEISSQHFMALALLLFPWHRKIGQQHIGGEGPKPQFSHLLASLRIYVEKAGPDALL